MDRVPSAMAEVTVRRLTSGMFAARDRLPLMNDEISRHLTGSEVAAADSVSDLRFRWASCDFGGGLTFWRGAHGNMTARRDGRLLKDSDEDISLFLMTGRPVRFEQNDRRAELSTGGMLIAHGRPVASWWPDCPFLLLRLPRAALPGRQGLNDAGGLSLPATSPALKLLRATMTAVWPLACDG